MLLELRIKDFAIIKDQSIFFTDGLNVLTGETGAGKTIILDALKLLLGGRANLKSIRSGCAEAQVEGLIDLSLVPDEILKGFPEVAFDTAMDSHLAITRIVSMARGSRVYINGKLATVSLLEKITRPLISLCSQNQSIWLLEEKRHLAALDEFGGYDELLQEVELAYEKWRKKLDELRRLEAGENELQFRREYLTEVVSALQKVGVYEGLEDSLEKDIARGSSSEKILENGSAVIESLEKEGGVLESLRHINAMLAQLSDIDPFYGELSDRIEASIADLSDLASELQESISSLETDEEALEALRSRLSELRRLERKYRRDESGLVALLKSAKRELSDIGDALSLDELRKETQILMDNFKNKASLLTDARKKAAKWLAKEIKKELSDLNMKGASFTVEVTQAQPSPKGIDHVRFLISTNKGEPIKPLRQVASGGELSRIMLAIRAVIGGKSHASVLVFDEVDTGVSGSVARSVGEKLKSISKRCQVITVTHLPQVASLADSHLLVRKADGIAEIVPLEQEEERVEEIARMLSGHKVTEASRMTAKELLVAQ